MLNTLEVIKQRLKNTVKDEIVKNNQEDLKTKQLKL